MKAQANKQSASKQKIAVILVAAVVGLGIGAFAGFTIGYDRGAKGNINTFEECVNAGYPIQESFPERCSLPDGRGFTKGTGESSTITFEGRVVCLPHHDTGGVHTLECAIGLQTDDGKYYGLKSDSSDSPISSAAGSDERIRIKGTLKQESSDTYQSIGTITVISYEFIAS